MTLRIPAIAILATLLILAPAAAWATGAEIRKAEPAGEDGSKTDESQDKASGKSAADAPGEKAEADVLASPGESPVAPAVGTLEDLFGLPRLDLIRIEEEPVAAGESAAADTVVWREGQVRPKAEDESRKDD